MQHPLTRNHIAIISTFFAALLGVGGIEAGCYTKGKERPLGAAKR